MELISFEEKGKGKACDVEESTDLGTKGLDSVEEACDIEDGDRGE